MPVTVYIWEHSREHSWGHSSLQVEGGPYINWWPMGNRTYTIDKKKHKHLAGIMKKMVGTTQVFKAAHKTNNSLQADIFAEERHPAWEVRLAKGVLDEKKINDPITG